MGLEVIRKQAISMEPIAEKSYSCPPGKEYCSLFKKGEEDFIFQMKQTPCGDNLLCNPNFELGAELVTNGTFTGSAAGWTLGAGWSYSLNNILHAGALNNLTQGIGPLVNGQAYIVSLEVVNFNVPSATLTVSLGGGTPSPIITDIGSYSFSVICGGGTAEILLAADNNMVIDNISVKTLDCWSFDDGWAFSGNQATHLPGSTTDLYETVFDTTFVAFDYFVLDYAIFGMTAGTLDIYVGGLLFRSVTSNGTYTDYGLPLFTDTEIIFRPSIDFDGTLTLASLYQLINYSNATTDFKIFDLDGNYIDTITNISVNEDRIDFNYPTEGLDDGCYRVVGMDACNDAVLENGSEVVNDPEFDDPGAWSFDYSEADPGQAAAVSGGEVIISNPIPFTTSDRIVIMNNTDYVFPDGSNWFSISATIETGAFTLGSPPAAITMTLTLPGGSGLAIMIGAPYILENSTYTANGIVNIINNPAAADYNVFGIRFYLDGTIEGDEFRFESLSIQIAFLADADNVLTSNCLSVLTDTGDAQLVQGVSSGHSNGFLFSSTFPALNSRNFVSFNNPHLPNPNGQYLYSSGVKKRTWGQLDKLWDLTIHGGMAQAGVDENMIDTIAASSNCDQFFIGNSNTDKKEYISVERDIAGNWDKAGSDTAELTLEVGRIDGVVFK